MYVHDLSHENYKTPMKETQAHKEKEEKEKAPPRKERQPIYMC